MDKDSVIDKVLHYLNEDEMVFLVEDLDIAQVLNVPDSFMSICLEKAYKYGLTDNDNNAGNYSYVRLSPFGKEVQDSGGWLAYLERERIHLANLDKQNKNSIKEPQKIFWLIMERFVILCSMVTFFILVAENISENTPYIGIYWWKNFLGL